MNTTQDQIVAPPEFDLSQIDSNFPLPSYRPGQRKAIELILKAFQDDHKFVFLEAPTGSGKSAIGFAIAQFFKYSYCFTPQKFLQDQYTRDYGENGQHLGGLKPMIDLKGRNAYPCDYWGRCLSGDRPEDLDFTEDVRKRYLELERKKLGCDLGQCKRDGKSKLDHCVDREAGIVECAYFRRLYKAMVSRVCLMNFHSFLFQSIVVPNFGHRDLMVIDECFHPHTHVITNKGRIQIGKIVNQRVDCKVLSYNFKSRILEFKPIVRYLRRGVQETYKVLAGNRLLYPTADHKIYTPSGVKRLRELTVGDDVYICEPEISHIQRQILFGSMLGDGSVHLVPSTRRSTKYVNKGIRARIKFSHGPKQFDYLDWKYNLLREHVNTPPRTISNSGFGKIIRRFTTKCNIYDAISPAISNNRFVINNNWISGIDNLGLAIWFMDDGSCSNDMVRFHTEGLSKEDNEKLIDWLRNDFRSVRIYNYRSKKKEFHYIGLNRSDSRLFCKRIAKFVPPFMRYKLATGKWPAYDKSIEEKRPHPISVQQIRSITAYKNSPVYDLEIGDNHNYFVGTTLVSNCHGTENVLLKFIEFSISDKEFVRDGIQFPELHTVQQYLAYFEEINLESLIHARIRAAVMECDIKAQDEWERQKVKLKMLMNCDPDRWISIWHQVKSGVSRSVTLKPIFVDDFANRYLFSKADRVLFMSATILSKNAMCEALGIDPKEAKSFRLPNMFPVSHRKIYYRPSGSMTYKKKAETLPRMVKDIDFLCRHHKDQRGIIHTHTFEITYELLNKCAPDVKCRFLFQKDMEFGGDKKKLVEKHSRTPNSIIIAPAMHEGLDLYDDLGRFQILCKVPYPSKGDPQIQARMEISSDYYDWLTATKMVQSYGRIVRHSKDHGVTYVLDQAFSWFVRKTEDILPDWFVEAIEWK